MRQKSISLMNIFMCFCVVAIHITSYPVMNFDQNSLWFKMVFIINRMIRFAVPCFVFLSGYKLQNRYDNEKVNVINFYIKRIKKIIIPYIICYIAYFLYFYSKEWVTKESFFSGLITGSLSAQFYFVIFIVQIYILFPLLKKAFDNRPFLLLAISMISTIVFNQFLILEYSYLLFGSWLLYFVLGMILAKYGREEIKHKIFALLAISFVIFTTLIVFMQYQSEVFNKYFEIYPTIFIVYSVISCCFFLYLFRFIEKKESKVQDKMIRLFDSNTYLIFLWHIFFINLAQNDWVPITQNRPKIVTLGAFLITNIGIILMCLIMNFIRQLIKKKGIHNVEKC